MLSNLSIKRFGWVILSASLVGLTIGGQPLRREDVRAKIDEVLDPIPKLLNEDPTGGKAQRHLIDAKLPNGVILSYFYDVESPLHASTPERRERVREVEEMLAAHEPAMIALLRASASQVEVPDALHGVLNFAPPTATLKAALLEITRLPEARGNSVRDAYNTIFKLKLDDEAVRQEVLTKIGYRDEMHTRAAQGADLLTMAATQWGMAELEPLFREFLSIPYTPENYPKRGGGAKLTAHYHQAVSGLSAFGVRGASFIDLLKARLSELDPGTDGDLIRRIKETIPILEGTVNPKPVINFKGQLLGISQVAWPEWKAAQNPDSEKVSNGGPAALRSNPLNNALSPQADDSTSSKGDKNRWLVPAAVILAIICTVIGVLWFAFKKRT